MANRSYKSIFHNKKELHEEHSTPVEEIKEEQATEAADTTVEKVSEEKNVEETKEVNIERKFHLFFSLSFLYLSQC